MQLFYEYDVIGIDECQFFTDLVEVVDNLANDGKIVIVADNAPIHKAKLVKEFILSNKKRISIFYIPSYSPELNPDEHVWAYLKAYELVAHQAQNKEELKKIVNLKMQKIAKKEELIHSFFMQNKVTKST